jgi:hypothetical protein
VQNYKAIFLLVFFCCGLNISVFSQKKINEETDIKKIIRKPKKPNPITEEFSVGIRFNTDGWAFVTERGFIKVDENKTNFVYAELSEKKHPKESKILNETFIALYPDQIKPLPYKYGKINNFYAFKFGVGQKRKISGKLDRKSVLIHWVYGAGISIGMLKPYYLELASPIGNNENERVVGKYDDVKYKDLFLSETNIIGGTSFTKGIGEVQLKPGLQLRTGFNFDFAPTQLSLLIVELGTSLEIYTSKIELMAKSKNVGTFVNLYADIKLGKRWRIKD